MKNLLLLLPLFFYTNTLTAQDRIESTVIQTWNDDQHKWERSKKYSFEYNQQNLVVSKLLQIRDHEKNAWKDKTRDRKKYNDDGYDIEYTQEGHSRIGSREGPWGLWSTRYKHYEFDENGKVKQLIYHHPDLPEIVSRDTLFGAAAEKRGKDQLTIPAGHEWLMNRGTNLEFDSKGNPVLKHYYACRNLFEYHIEYSDSGLFLGYTKFEIDPLTDEKTLYSRLTHYYDEPSLISETTVELNEPFSGEKQKVEAKMWISSRFKLYPNPANGHTTVELIDFPSGMFSIELLDNLGKTLQQIPIDTRLIQKTTLDVTDLPAGMYTVVIRSQELLKAKRLVKIE